MAYYLCLGSVIYKRFSLLNRKDPIEYLSLHFTFHLHSHIDSHRNSHFTSRVSNFMFSQRLLIENKIRFSKKTLFYSKKLIRRKI